MSSSHLLSQKRKDEPCHGVMPQGNIVCFFDEQTSDEYVLVGGFYMHRSMMKALDNVMAKVKGSFKVPPREPVKWNLKDPICKVARKNILNEGRVDEFRSTLIEELNKLNIRLLMSVIETDSRNASSEAWKVGFAYILQRLSLIFNKKKEEFKSSELYPVLEVVFDYLPGGNKKGKISEYFDVYSEAYYRGYRFFRNTLPPLKNFGACPCLLVTSTRVSPALQAADILLGIVGDFVKWVYTGKRSNNVEKYFIKIYNNFHKDEERRTLGRGFLVDKHCKAKIARRLKELNLPL